MMRMSWAEALITVLIGVVGLLTIVLLVERGWRELRYLMNIKPITGIITTWQQIPMTSLVSVGVTKISGAEEVWIASVEDAAEWAAGGVGLETFVTGFGDDRRQVLVLRDANLPYVPLAERALQNAKRRRYV